MATEDLLSIAAVARGLMMICIDGCDEGGGKKAAAAAGGEDERLHTVLLAVIALGTMLQMWRSIAAAAMVDVC
jgi:hypothetical protein